MHQPITHLWREGQHLFKPGDLYVGTIISLFAPGCYFVRDYLGRGCYTEEGWLEATGVEVKTDESIW